MPPGGRIKLPEHQRPLAKEWLGSLKGRPPFVAVVGLDERVAIECCQLPGTFHRDPADRMIVATARIHGLTLLTKDQAIRDYVQVKTLWA